MIGIYHTLLQLGVYNPKKKGPPIQYQEVPMDIT